MDHGQHIPVYFLYGCLRTWCRGGCNADADRKNLGWYQRPDDGNTDGAYSYKVGTFPPIHFCRGAVFGSIYNSDIYRAGIWGHCETGICLCHLHFPGNGIHYDKCAIFSTADRYDT